jgi:aldose 1-epimerase
MDDDRLLLRTAQMEVGVDLAHGAVLTHWKWRDMDLLRPRPRDSRDPLDAACFFMCPFSNVIEGGKLMWAGKHVPMAPNHPAEPFPIHGDAWLVPWTLDRRSGGALTAHYAHDGLLGFPFRYRVSLRVALTVRSLIMSLRLSNIDHRSMPAGLGIHPYFPRTNGTFLRARHDGRWTGTSVAPDNRFQKAQELPKETIDDCFVEWSRRASLIWGEAALQISICASAAAKALVVFSPSKADFLCVEPVSHVNNGMNAHTLGIRGTGVKILAPGASLSLGATFTAALRTQTPNSP